MYTPCPYSVIPQSFFKPLQSCSSSHHSTESAPAQGSKDICVAKCNNCSSVLISFDPLAAFNGVINPFSLKLSALDFCYTTISESFWFLNYTIIGGSLCACNVHAFFLSVCLCATFYSLGPKNSFLCTWFNVTPIFLPYSLPPEPVWQICTYIC